MKVKRKLSNKEKAIRYFIILCTVLILIVSEILIFAYKRESEAKSYDVAIQTAMTSESLDKYFTYSIDFESLKRRNDDIFGWIYQQDSLINYPVVQCDNNSTYLHQRFDGESEPYGTIFVDYRYNRTDSNMILYGHNQSRRNQVKFSSLLNYIRDEDYITTHPFFEYYDEGTGDRLAYYVFAIVKADLSTQENIDKYYDMNPDDFQSYIDWLKLQSIQDTGVDTSSATRSMILSTCITGHYDTRCLICCIAE